MPESRREFLTHASLGILGTVVASKLEAQNPPADLPPGAPPAFGTATPVGPQVSTRTFQEAQKLVQIDMGGAEMGDAAGNWRTSMAPLYERRTGPRKVALETTDAPWSRWDPLLPGATQLPAQNQFVRSNTDPGPLPASDEDIAFAPLTSLSRWIESRQLTSERLTKIYLARLEQFNPQAALRHHADPRPCAGAGPKQADRGDRRGQISRSAAWHSLGRQGSARHRRHTHHLRR